MVKDDFDDSVEQEEFLQKIGFLDGLREFYPEKDLYEEAKDGALDGLYCLDLIREGEKDFAIGELLDVSEEETKKGFESPYWRGLKGIFGQCEMLNLYEIERQFIRMKINELQEFGRVKRDNDLMRYSMDRNFN